MGALGLALLSLLVVVLLIQFVGPTLDAIRGLGFARPQPTGAIAAPKPDPALQRRIEAVAAEYPGDVSVVVRDLSGGSVASLEADRQLPAASLFKLPIMVEVLKQQRLKRLAPDQLLEIRQEHWTDGSGVLQARIGESLPVSELLRLMVEESDNIAALVLLDAVGVENVNATMQAMGLRQTRLRDRMAGEGGLHLTSAADMAKLLEEIAAGRLIDAQTSEQALRLLELKQANTWLGEELPWWVKVAHKWGSLPSARHDAGIVYSPRKTYVLVVLTQGGKGEEAQSVIARTSRAVFEQIGA